MSWYLDVLRKYAVFAGRARRKEYWLFALFNFLIVSGISVAEWAGGLYDHEVGYGPISAIYSLAVFIPGLAVLVRRLHDTGRSGWWILIAVVPVIGVVVLLVFTVLDGDPGVNEYGSSPKGLEV